MYNPGKQTFNGLTFVHNHTHIRIHIVKQYKADPTIHVRRTMLWLRMSEITPRITNHLFNGVCYRIICDKIIFVDIIREPTLWKDACLTESICCLCSFFSESSNQLERPWIPITHCFRYGRVSWRHTSICQR